MTIDRHIAHFNRAWFKGVITYLDQPSDAPVTGAKNPGDEKEDSRRLFIPTDVAAGALDSLIGMPIYYEPEFKRHTFEKQCGIITEASIIGRAIVVRGFLYSYDHPVLITRLKNATTGEVFGFSYDLIETHIQNIHATDVWVATQTTFRGVTLVLAKHAAYRRTRIYLED